MALQQRDLRLRVHHIAYSASQANDGLYSRLIRWVSSLQKVGKLIHDLTPDRVVASHKLKDQVLANIVVLWTRGVQGTNREHRLTGRNLTVGLALRGFMCLTD